MLNEAWIRNAWYVCARSHDIGRTLTPLMVLGERIVLFRKTGGDVAALEDACPHRKLPLSKGALDGDRVVCGYH
jgi:vanillate O-demethylase monooxygenase subunit